MSSMNFHLFPRDILDTNILPLLSYLDLGRLSQASVTMLRVVENYLSVYTSLDMSLVTARLSPEDWPAKLPKAFVFLTKGAKSLRRLVIENYEYAPVASLETLRKVLRKNQNLQIVTLINIKLTSSVMRVILELENLKRLEISPEICPGVKFTNILEMIVKKGCKVIHHHPQGGNAA